MEDAIGIQLSLDAQNEGGLAPRNDSARAKSATWLLILDWYQILRVHHPWSMVQAIRYALWLTR